MELETGLDDFQVSVCFFRFSACTVRTKPFSKAPKVWGTMGKQPLNLDHLVALTLLKTKLVKFKWFSVCVFSAYQEKSG